MEIPNDHLFCILEFLNFDDLVNCFLVSKQFNEIVNNEIYWKSLTTNDFDFMPCGINNYKNTYKQYYSFDKFLLKKTKLNLSGTILLQGLYIRNLTTLPNQIGLLTKLKELNLSHNLLKTLPLEIGLLTQLDNLNVRNCNITGLPETIGCLTNIEILTFSKNDLEKLPDSIGKLTKLKKLGINHNCLVSLPTQINQLTQLPKLNASYNHLQSFQIPQLI